MRLNYFHTRVVLLGAVLSFALPSLADDKPANEYKESGTVLSMTSERGHFYQIQTDGRIFLLLCDKVKSLQFGQPECRVGNKPIAVGDTVHFRVDGDWAYMPPASEGEQKLRVLAVELRAVPALAPKASDPNSSPSNEPAIVIGTGLHVKGQHGAGWSTNPAPAASPVTTASAATPVMPTAPVTAIPVNGGAPVTVIPTGPTTGGVVTGVPVTGGAPVTGIPTAPVTGTPMGGAHPGGQTIMIGGGPQWVHVLRIQTGSRIYQLECSSRPCALADKEIALGDTLTLRVDKKWAYLSSDAPNPKEEQKYKILGVSESGSASTSKPE
jgi:hypothetical protein